MRSPALLILGLCLLPLLAAIAIVARRPLLAALPFLAALNGVGVPIAGANVRLDQLVAATLTVGLLLAAATGRRKLYVDLPMVLLGVLALLNALASLLYSPARGYSLAQVLNLVSVWAIYAVVVNEVRTVAQADRLVSRTLAAGFAASLVGISAFLLAVAGLPVGGANFKDITDGSAAFGAYGTMVEPNLFGSYCQAMFVIAVGLALCSPAFSRGLGRARIGLVAAASALGLFLSFTRGAWIGALFGLGVLVVLAARYAGVRVRPSRIIIPIAVLALAAVGLWYSPFQSGEFFRYKVRNLLNPESETAAIRLLTYGLAFGQWSERRWLGRGTYTFAALTAEGGDFRQFAGWQNMWIGNYLVLVLHDTGIVGLFVFVALLFVVIRRALQSARRLRAVNASAAGRQISLVAALLSLMVSFLTSSGFSLGYSWWIVGLIGAYTRCSSELAAPSAQAEPPAPRVRRPALSGAA